AAVGGLLGSKLLFLLEDPALTLAQLGNPAYLIGGKTIVGGLLGGWIGVELAKRAVGIARSTGDLLVPPLIVGLVVGRLGCLFAGAGDHTSGHLAAVPWALDLGDGRRHPTQAYEIGFLGLCALLDRLPARRDGDRFLRFIGAYLAFRVVVDFWKAPFGPDPVLPHPHRLPVGLTPIQAVSLLGACYAAGRLLRRSA
ncbi:MAG: prolipoprotein diacylglyceryl transferase family protein, partial [Myxococcota bacterium]